MPEHQNMTVMCVCVTGPDTAGRLNSCQDHNVLHNRMEAVEKVNLYFSHKMSDGLIMWGISWSPSEQSDAPDIQNPFGVCLMLVCVWSEAGGYSRDAGDRTGCSSGCYWSTWVDSPAGHWQQLTRHRHPHKSTILMIFIWTSGAGLILWTFQSKIWNEVSTK